MTEVPKQTNWAAFFAAARDRVFDHGIILQVDHENQLSFGGIIEKIEITTAEVSIPIKPSMTYKLSTGVWTQTRRKQGRLAFSLDDIEDVMSYRDGKMSWFVSDALLLTFFPGNHVLSRRLREAIQLAGLT